MIIEKTKNNKYKPTNDYMFSRVFGDSDCREILKCKHISSALEQWLTFIINDDLEEIKNMDNELIQNAESKLELLNNDEKAKEIAEMLIDAERNERSALANARQEGHAEGRAKGRVEGIAQEKIEVVKKMLEKNLNIDLIVDITGINKEEILEIKNSL